MIRYLLIEEERFEDAPFVGALVCAISCPMNCKNCFNKHLKGLEVKKASAEEIVDTIKRNPFHEGMILGGLEWSEQPDEMLDLAREAVSRDLKVMIYTGLTIEQFLHKVPDIRSLRGDIYLKYGAYHHDLPGYRSRYGVQLASRNQKILQYRSREEEYWFRAQ